MIIKYVNITICLIILIFNIGVASAQESKWELKKNEDGIIIHTREDIKTGNIEFKASIEIETNINTLIKVLNNIEGYTKWMANAKVSKTIKIINDKEQYIYLEIKAPWPLENRDITIYQKTIITNKSTNIFLVAKPNYIPHKKGIIRIEDAVGSWKLIPLPNNKVKVIYRFVADPGLDIPNWIINLFIVDGPFKTLSNLKSIVEH